VLLFVNKKKQKNFTSSVPGGFNTARHQNESARVQNGALSEISHHHHENVSQQIAET
jgi:hypothetical protein